MKSKHIDIIGIILLILLIILFLSSCKVTKYVEKEVTKVDSSVIVQNEGLQRALKETIEAYEKEREQWENTGVVFQDCPDTGSVKTVTKIVFDNGKIKSIEGNVKALNQSLHEKSAELYYAHSLIDSLSFELERKEIALSKKQTEVVKEVKTKVIPHWIWLLFILGWIARHYWPRIHNYIKSKIPL